MKAKVSAFFTTIIGAILGLLGFQSCGLLEKPVMYGTPHVDFSYKGKVSDESKKPVPGAKVVIDAYFSWTDGAGFDYTQLDYTDTLYTDSRGNVEKTVTLFDKSSNVVVTITDVDGPENGEFEETVIDNLQMNKVKDGSGGWYGGAYEMEFDATVKMKK